MKLLKLGSTGMDVLALSFQLLDHKLLNINEITYTFDRELERKVLLFQKKHGLVMDGIVGKQTRESLDKSYNNEQLDKITTITPSVFNAVLMKRVIDAIQPMFGGKFKLATMSRPHLDNLIASTTLYKNDLRGALAHLFGQARQETGYKIQRYENLRYSANALISTFSYYRRNPKLARSHAYEPRLIANHAYANRNGNGGIESNDGYTYRGRGLPMITGRGNYAKLTKDFKKHYGLDVDFINNPDYVCSDKYAMMVVLLDFKTRVLDKLDLTELKPTRSHSAKVTRLINRYTKSYGLRLKYTKQAYKLLKDI